MLIFKRFNNVTQVVRDRSAVVPRSKRMPVGMIDKYGFVQYPFVGQTVSALTPSEHGEIEEELVENATSSTLNGRWKAGTHSDSGFIEKSPTV